MRIKTQTFKGITLIIVVSIAIYFAILACLKLFFFTSDSNEFGDFVGGVLNPLFTLLSTVAIVMLTYTIARADDIKAEKAIEIQKRIALNQMRQNVFEGIIHKTNLYIYEIDKLSIQDAPTKFQQMVLTRMAKEKGSETKRVTVWLIILNELENFAQWKHLFSGLFTHGAFKNTYDELTEITATLCREQDDFHFVKEASIHKYIEIQQTFLNMVGEYILSEY